MYRIIFLVILLLIGNFSWAQELKNYQFYNQKKLAINFHHAAKILAKYDIVLFGEHHNDAIIHWLQLKLAEELHKKSEKKLVLGFEMFERDNQAEIEHFLNGEISEKTFTDSVRFWSNYKTDYKPLILFAKERNLRVIASNVPRRYAALVAKNGLATLDQLPKNEKKWMATLPLVVDEKTPGYPEMIDMMKDHSTMNAQNFVYAQALKDATMAESILQHRKNDELILHYNGDYHSKNYGGIFHYLKRFEPKLKVAVISVIANNKLLPEFEDQQQYTPTEILLVIPSDSPKSH
ncbi:ChaN family lipoprotein [Vaginella massiliensis]|uniref:ChaN family lipoprotein n=1 Tax=Vaginella massiliensis TaxID=1816680 RepID=UPI000838DF7D|nr:ChaN family lipoprotein [Vaginella massiliensis]